MFGQEKLFELALNIEEPLYIKDIEFDEDQKELHIYIDFRKGSLFKCSICGKDVPVHDTEEKTWRHLNFFQHKAFLHFRTPRTKCPEDGVHFTSPSWAGKGDFTLLMDAMIMQLAKYLPVSQISSLLGEHDTKIWRIIKRYVSTAQAINDLSKVRKVGMDETASKRGHNYITLFVDMEKKAVIYATEGKGADTIKEFKEELPLHYAHPSNIEEFSVDMSPAFIKGIGNNFPWAVVTFDRFHVMKMINEAIDKTRRSEQKEILDLKSTRFIWLKNQENLSEKQKNKLDELSQSNLKTGKAYRMKLALQEIYGASLFRVGSSEFKV